VTTERNEIGLYEAMSTLRAVRRLRPDPVPDDVLGRVIEAASWAPTGGNLQPWRVVVVRDAEHKRRLGELYAARWSEYAAGHRALLADVPESVREKQERMLRAGDYLGAHFGDSPVIAVFCFNAAHMAITDADLGRLSVVGGASIYTAVENLLLACRAEGLGCVLTTLLCAHEPAVRELLAIPEPWATAAAVPIGYPLLKGHGPISRRPVEKLAFDETWGIPLAPRAG
jgi:nitroreductase